MTELMNELLVLIIVAAYFRMLLVLCFIAGQLLIIVIEALADWIERVQERREHRHENDLYKRRARLAARRRKG